MNIADYSDSPTKVLRALCWAGALCLSLIAPSAKAEPMYFKIRLPSISIPTEASVFDDLDVGGVFGFVAGLSFDERLAIEVEYAHLFVFGGDDGYAPQILFNILGLFPIDASMIYVGIGGGLMWDVRDEILVRGYRFKRDDGRDDRNRLRGGQLILGMDFLRDGNFTPGVEIRYQYFTNENDEAYTCSTEHPTITNCNFTETSGGLQFLQISAHLKWR